MSIRATSINNTNDNLNEKQLVSFRFMETNASVLRYIMGDKYHDGIIASLLDRDLTRIKQQEKVITDQIKLISLQQALGIVSSLRKEKLFSSNLNYG